MYKGLALLGDAGVFELDFPILLYYVRFVNRFQPLPQFPAVVRDVAVVVDEDIPT